MIAYFLGSHYRSPLPFSDERLDDAAMACQRIRNAVRALDRALDGPGTGDDLALAAAVVESRQRFHDSMDDDLGTPGAMAAIFDLVRAIHQALERGCPAAGQIREVRQQLVALLDMLGLAGLGNEVSAEMPDEVRELMRRREEARSARDFAGADALRDAIGALGFELRDGPGGPEVYSAP